MLSICFSFMQNGPGMGSYGDLMADLEESLLSQRSSYTSGSGLTKLKEDRFRSHIQHRLTELEGNHSLD